MNNLKERYLLHLGPGKSMPGGMLSVIQDILSANMSRLNVKQIHIATASKTHKIITFLLAVIRVISLCIFNKIALAHIHMSERGSVKRTKVLLKILHFFDVKTIVHSHGGMICEEYNKMSETEKNELSDSLKLSDILIVLTNGWKDFWKGIVDETKIRIIPNGVNIPNNTKKKYKINNVVNVLYLGYISKEKGAFDLVTALSLLTKKGFKYHAFFAGNGEGNLLTEQIKDKGLDKYIDYVGWADSEKKIALFKKCDILVLPSYYESFGIVAIEAMSWKLPVICGNKGFTKEVIIENETGLIANVGDCENIADKIMKLGSTEILTRMGNSGYMLVKEKYNLPLIMEQLQAVYKELLQTEITERRTKQ